MKFCLLKLGTRFFIKLEFKIEKIRADPPLEMKLNHFSRNPFIHRIYAKIVIMKPDGGEIRPITGIIDTGAIFSLFPSYILNYFPEINKISHTIWGIMDSPECHLLAELACIDIKLMDKNGIKSKPVNILASFSSNTKVPVLLGMKDLLESYDSKIIQNKAIFEIEI